MVKRSRESEQLLTQLDSELAESAERSGMKLSWSASDREHLGMVADIIDRRVHLQGRYENCDPLDTKNLVRLSTEIRLCATTVSRLLAKINTDVPMPESQATIRARRAAMRRWHPGATG